jgi:hypothetical protein
LEEISEGLHLKEDVAFALLITISPHTITMFNKIDNLHGLDAIFNGKNPKKNPIFLLVLGN